jgi:hypothetical protein
MMHPPWFRRLLLNPTLRHLQAWLGDPQPARCRTYRPCLEELEDRRVPSVTAVSNEIQVGAWQGAMPLLTTTSVAAASDGRFAVAWTAGMAAIVSAAVFNADGTARTGELVVDAGVSSSLPGVAMDAQGGFVVTWTSNGQDGSGTGVFARLYNAAGTAQGTAFQVNQFTTGNQDASRVGMDSQGDFVVTWQSDAQDGSGTGVFARLYNAVGTAQGAEFQVNQSTTGNQQSPSVAMDGQGVGTGSGQRVRGHPDHRR